MRRHYVKEDLEFAAAVAANPSFRPRFHLLYSEREAEQDAYLKIYCSETCVSIATRKRLGKYPERRTVTCSCGRIFETGKSWHRFCSRKCATAHYNQRWQDRNDDTLQLSTGTVGAISELIVATDLLMKGCDVFRSLSPACGCDLAIIHNGRLLRVEVTTAYIGPSGKRIGCRKDDYSKYEIVAYVIKPNYRVEYEPSLENCQTNHHAAGEE